MPAFPTTLFTDSLGCPTCFSPQLQHPMLLVPCGHTVCRSCLDDLPGPPKQCPICSSPIESACTNFLVQRLVSEESQDPFVQCDDCGWSGRATKYDEHPDNVRKHRAQQAANSAVKSPGNLDNAPGNRPQQQRSTVDGQSANDAVSGKPTAASSRAAAARAVVTARQRLHGAVRSTAAKANHALSAWEHQEEERVLSELEAVSHYNGAGGHNDGVEVEVLWDTELDGFFTKVDATVTEASTIEDQRPSSPHANVADDDNDTENESEKVEKNSNNDVDKAQRSAATVSVTADVFQDPLSAYQQIMEALLDAEVISGAHEIRTKVFVDVARAALSTRARNALTHLSSSSTSNANVNAMTADSDKRQTLEKIQALFTQEDDEGGDSSSSSHGVDEAHRSLRPLLGGLSLVLETSSSKSSASKMSEANSASPIDKERLKEIIAAGASPNWGSLTDFACEIVPQISAECRRKITALLPSSVSNTSNERQTAVVSAEGAPPKAPDAQSTQSSQAKSKSPSSSLPPACGVARAVEDLIAMSKAVNSVIGSSKSLPKDDSSKTARTAAAAVVLPAVAFVCGSAPPTGLTAMITALRRVGRKVFVFHGISDPKKRRVFDLFASKSFFIEQLGHAAVVRRSAADMPLLSVPQMVSSSPNADATSSETQTEDKNTEKKPKELELTASKTTVMSFLAQVRTEIHGPEITAAMAALNDALTVAESVTTNIDDSPQATQIVDGVSSANVGQASGSLLLPPEHSAGNNATGGSKGGVAFQQQSSATTDAGSDVPRSDFDAAFIAQWAQQTHPTSAGGSAALAPVGGDETIHTHDSNSHNHSHPDLQTVKDHTSSTAGSIAGPLMTSSTTHRTELSSQTLATTSTSAATTSVQIAGKPAAAAAAASGATAHMRESKSGEASSVVRGGSARQPQADHQEHQDPFLGATFSTSAAPFQRQLVMSNRERTAAFSAVTGADGGIESLGVVESGAVDFTGLHAIHMQSSSDLNIAASLASATASTATTNTNADARLSGVVGKTELPTQSGRRDASVNNAPTSPTQPMLNVAVRAPKKPDAVVPLPDSQGDTAAPQVLPVATTSVADMATARSSAKSSAKSSESIEKAVHAAPFVPPSAGGSGFTPPTPAGFSPTLAPASAAAAPAHPSSGGVHVQVGQVGGVSQFGLATTSNRVADRGAPELGLRVGASAFSPPALSSDNNGPSVGTRFGTMALSRADGRDSGSGRPIASSSSTSSANAQSSVSTSSRGGEGKRHQFGTSAATSAPQETTTPLSYQGQSFIPKQSGAPPHTLQESQSGPQGQRPQQQQQQKQQQPRRVEFVLVDGEKIAVEDLLQNRGLTYLLEHPSASGRWCKTQHPNASAPRACGFVHWKPGRRSGSVTPSGLHGSFAGTATPNANAPPAASAASAASAAAAAAAAAVALSPVAAVKAPTTASPDPRLEATSEVVRDGVGSPLKKPEDTYRMTEFVVVEGERVQCQELVFNTGLYFLQSHPNRQGRWCRGHPAHVKDEECSFIHSTDNDRMPTEGKADMPARVEVEGQSVELWKLVYNAGIKRIVTGVAASAKWCRGHPQNITDETCTYIHAKPDVPEPEGQP